MEDIGPKIKAGAERFSAQTSLRMAARGLFFALNGGVLIYIVKLSSVFIANGRWIVA